VQEATGGHSSLSGAGQQEEGTESDLDENFMELLLELTPTLEQRRVAVDVIGGDGRRPVRCRCRAAGLARHDDS
jgi:hypothetical protein